MPESLKALALSGAVRDVLETMFFTDVLGEQGGDASQGPALDARLSFQGGRAGAFRLAIAPAAARTVAGNFLGADDDAEISETAVTDAICELANMVCGSVLSRFNGELAFDLSHPELVPENTPWPESAARTFQLENGWLTAAVHFEGS